MFVQAIAARSIRALDLPLGNMKDLSDETYGLKTSEYICASGTTFLRASFCRYSVICR